MHVYSQKKACGNFAHGRMGHSHFHLPSFPFPPFLIPKLVLFPFPWDSHGYLYIVFSLFGTSSLHDNSQWPIIIACYDAFEMRRRCNFKERSEIVLGYRYWHSKVITVIHSCKINRMLVSQNTQNHSVDSIYNVHTSTHFPEFLHQYTITRKQQGLKCAGTRRYCVLALLRKAWDSTGTSVKKKLTTAM